MQTDTLSDSNTDVCAVCTCQCFRGGDREERRGLRQCGEEKRAKAALVDATGTFLSYPTMSASLKLGNRGLSLSHSYFRERALTTLRDVFQATEDTYLQSEALFSKA